MEGLRRHGVDARGIDFSRYAIATAPESVRSYVAIGDVTAIEFPANCFDLVICNETLEHLPPERVGVALAELYRVTADKLWVTAPSMGQNDFGPPDGWPQGKIRETSLPRYLDNPHHPDPALPADLMLDKDGFPIHGHLTMASYRWWTEQFTGCGFVRRGDIEKQMTRNEPLLRDGLWNGYVLEKPRPGADSEQAGADRQAAAQHLLTHPFTGDTASLTAAPRLSEDDLWRADQMISAPTSITGIALPPGWYEVGFAIRVTLPDAAIDERTLVAIVDIRSSSRQKIHAIRVLRLLDFAPQTSRILILRFGSSGESDFEFCVQPAGACTVRVAPRLVNPVALPLAR